MSDSVCVRGGGRVAPPSTQLHQPLWSPPQLRFLLTWVALCVEGDEETAPNGLQRAGVDGLAALLPGQCFAKSVPLASPRKIELSKLDVKRFLGW